MHVSTSNYSVFQLASKPVVLVNIVCILLPLQHVMPKLNRCHLVLILLNNVLVGRHLKMFHCLDLVVPCMHVVVVWAW